ncbi:MAG: peptide deformylase [Patescibacteria group bacterium]|nr:peptide deformylase [Patescibacteria group bacterium]
MRVVKAPDERLRIKTKPVKKVTADLLQTTREMIKLTESFQDPEGVGLASTQVGLSERFFIAKLGKKFVACFNPKILSYSPKEKSFFEGCLSIPDYYAYTKRPIAVTVEYENERGQKVTRKLRGFDAWVFQHETDHLNGTLFMDHVLRQNGRIFKSTGRDKSGSEIFEEIKLT